MAQIGKDYYEDLTVESFGRVLDDLRAGKVPVPGSQSGRYAAEPASGLTSLSAHGEGRMAQNASVARAVAYGDTVKRIDGTEQPLQAAGTPDAAPESEEAAPTPQAEAAPQPVETGLITPSTRLPGQEDLANRKGNWRFEPDAD
jgi:NADH-quinone oxidoreductase subunit E